jgi:pyrrolysyl-tRNA synthetase-like protein
MSIDECRIKEFCLFYLLKKAKRSEIHHSSIVNRHSMKFLIREINIVGDKTKVKQPARRYYRKRVELFRLIEKIKLWPSRRGLLHGIKTINVIGSQARITTHCNKTFLINDSRNSRAARWLRNKWFSGICGVCRVPDWKVAKYSSTHFKRHYGSALVEDSKVQSSRVQQFKSSKVKGPDPV